MRASRTVYHPNGDANDFQTVEATLDKLQFGADAKLGGNTGSSDNKLLRSDGTGGKTVQASPITVDDAGNLTSVGTINGNPVFATATEAEYRAGTAGAKALTPEEVYDAMAFVALTDAATIAVDMATGFNFSVSIAGNRTIGNPTNVQVGKVLCFKVTASGGNRTIDLGSSFKKTEDFTFPVDIASGQTAYIYGHVVASDAVLVLSVLSNPS
jgi:hypothetical protein